MARSALRKIAPVIQMTPAVRPEPQQLALSIIAPPVGPNLSDADRAEAERRYGVIEPLLNRDKYLLLHPTRAGMIDWLVQSHSVKRATIYSWLQRWNKGGLPALVSKDRSDKGKPRVFNAAALEFLLAASMPRRGVYGVLTVKEIFRAYEEERVWRAANIGKVMGDFEQSKYTRYIDEDGKLREAVQLPQVSYQSMWLWFNKIPEVARVMARDGEEAYRNTQEVLSFRDLAAIEPLDYVVMDHRRLDIFCMAPERGGWKLIRPWLTAAIDMRTRKWLGWVIVESPSSDSIAAVLKRVFIDHGVPKAVYWDNGKDFRCEWLEGKQSHTRQAERASELSPTWRGVMGTLGIRVHHAIVRNARAKIIEPNFVRVANFDRTLPEWCGHKPGARPDNYPKLIAEHDEWERGDREKAPFRSLDQVADLYGRALDDLNERELEGEGMQKATPRGRGWMCPNEAWEIMISRVERKTVPVDVLHMCFAKRKKYTVQHGEIKMRRGNRDYHYRMIGSPIALMQINGEVVELAYDPMDLGEGAVYHQDRFVGLVGCVELRRMGETAFVDDERNRRSARRAVKGFIEAAHNAIPMATPDERLDRRREATPNREAVSRVCLPVELPAGVVEAEAERRVARDFQFDQVATAEVNCVPPPVAEDDSEFRFFQGD